MSNPLELDMQKLLVFKMPKAESVQIYDKIDDDQEIYDIRDSQYFKQKRHLGGFLGEKKMKELKK